MSEGEAGLTGEAGRSKPRPAAEAMYRRHQASVIRESGLTPVECPVCDYPAWVQRYEDGVTRLRHPERGYVCAVVRSPDELRRIGNDGEPM